MSRPALITIHLDALRHNLAQVRKLAPKSKVLAMVKANAYGHGLIGIAKALNHADGLGVASLEEGIALREAGIKQPIFLMEGLFNVDELTLAALHHFTLIVHHADQITMLQSVRLQKPLQVWLKVNTGMNRLGIAPADFNACYGKLLTCQNVAQPIGVMTHFAEADNPKSEVTARQVDCFNAVIEGVQAPLSLSNSAGILAWPSVQADWVRPGLMLYGASPFTKETGLERGLKPVMTFSSKLMAVHAVKRGEKVGYGGTWTAHEATRIGIVAAGYGDGYPQQAKNGTPVLVNGQVCPLVGRVSMDMLAVDLKESPKATLGDPVILWGQGLPVEWVANQAMTSPYELLTRITTRPKIVTSL
ncbi:MAG TPA: alanine racemase [Gammaproteobacteria bacterium]|nr:alanine racemase [Gammaproteobacteria bacterium]